MDNKKIIDAVFLAIEKYGLMETIGELFGAGAQIKMDFNVSALKTPICDLGLSVRSYNALSRAGLDTVEKVIDAMQENKIASIRSLGAKSKAEIHVKIYEFGYASMSERAKKEFANTLVALNLTEKE